MLGFSAISEAPISTLAGGLIIVDATGQQVNISLGDIDVVSSVLLTGQQLTTIGTYTISAGGAITVVVPEFTINTLIGDPVLSTGGTIGITGQEATVELNSVIPGTSNLITISGQQANTNIGSFVISTSNVLDITGQEINITLASIITSTGNTVSLTGQQMTVIPATLRFWDPIPPETNVIWTNI